MNCKPIQSKQIDLEQVLLNRLHFKVASFDKTQSTSIQNPPSAWHSIWSTVAGVIVALLSFSNHTFCRFSFVCFLLPTKSTAFLFFKQNTKLWFGLFVCSLSAPSQRGQCVMGMISCFCFCFCFCLWCHMSATCFA